MRFESRCLVAADRRQVAEEDNFDRRFGTEQIAQCRVLELAYVKHANVGRTFRRALAFGKRIQGTRQEAAGPVERIGRRLAVDNHDRNRVAHGDGQRSRIVQAQVVGAGTNLQNVLTGLLESILLFERECDGRGGLRRDADELLPNSIGVPRSLTLCRNKLTGNSSRTSRP